MKKSRKLIFIVGGLLILVLCVVLLRRTKSLVVEVVEVKRGSVESTISTTVAGTIEAKAMVSLTPDYPGRIIRINVKEGDTVKTGDSIVEMDNEEQKLALRKAQREYERVKPLFEKGLASRQQWDMVQDSLDAARIAYEKTILRAPFNGTLVKLNATVGDRTTLSVPASTAFSGGGSSSLAVLVDTSSMYVSGDVDEVDVGSLAVGQPVRISLDSYPGQKFTGTLSEISPLVSTTLEQNRTVPIKVEVPVRTEFIVGMSADVEIIVGSRDNTLYIPTNAILEKDGDRFVYTVNGKKAARVLVTIGISNWDMTEITKGLEEKSLVIIPTDEKKLEDGIRVKTRPLHRPGAATAAQEE